MKHESKNAKKGKEDMRSKVKRETVEDILETFSQLGLLELTPEDAMKYQQGIIRRNFKNHVC